MHGLRCSGLPDGGADAAAPAAATTVISHYAYIFAMLRHVALFCLYKVFSQILGSPVHKVEHLLNACHAELPPRAADRHQPGRGALILETNAQDVVQRIRTNNLLDSVGHLLAEIKCLVRLNLLSFRCVCL